MASEKHFDRLLEIVRDKSHRSTRQIIVLGMGSTLDGRSEPILIDLLSDPDVAGRAVMALGKIGTENTVVSLNPFLNTRDQMVRAEARKALSSIHSRRNAS